MDVTMDSDLEEGEIPSPSRVKQKKCFNFKQSSDRCRRSAIKRRKARHRKKAKGQHWDFDAARKRLLLRLKQSHPAEGESLVLPASDISEVDMKDVNDDCEAISSDEDLTTLRLSALHSQKSVTNTEQEEPTNDVEENEFHLRAEALKTAIMKNRGAIRSKKGSPKAKTLKTSTQTTKLKDSIDNQKNVEANRTSGESSKLLIDDTSGKENNGKKVATLPESVPRRERRKSRSSKSICLPPTPSPPHIGVIDLLSPEIINEPCSVDDDETELRLQLLKDLKVRSSPRKRDNLETENTPSNQNELTKQLPVQGSQLKAVTRKRVIEPLVINFSNQNVSKSQAHVIFSANKIVKKSINHYVTSRTILGKRKLINNHAVVNKKAGIVAQSGNLNKKAEMVNQPGRNAFNPKPTISALRTPSLPAAAIPTVRPVPKVDSKQGPVIVCLGEDSSDDDVTQPAKDDTIDKRIDEFLRGARQQTEKKLEVNLPPTPQSVYAHLPPAQKLEYIRLKRELVEKEKLKLKAKDASLKTADESVPNKSGRLVYQNAATISLKKKPDLSERLSSKVLEPTSKLYTKPQTERLVYLMPETNTDDLQENPEISDRVSSKGVESTSKSDSMKQQPERPFHHIAAKSSSSSLDNLEVPNRVTNKGFEPPLKSDATQPERLVYHIAAASTSNSQQCDAQNRGSIEIDSKFDMTPKTSMETNRLSTVESNSHRVPFSNVEKVYSSVSDERRRQVTLSMNSSKLAVTFSNRATATSEEGRNSAMDNGTASSDSAGISSHLSSHRRTERSNDVYSKIYPIENRPIDNRLHRYSKSNYSIKDGSEDLLGTKKNVSNHIPSQTDQVEEIATKCPGEENIIITSEILQGNGLQEAKIRYDGKTLSTLVDLAVPLVSEHSKAITPKNNDQSAIRGLISRNDGILEDQHDAVATTVVTHSRISDQNTDEVHKINSSSLSHFTALTTPSPVADVVPVENPASSSAFMNERVNNEKLGTEKVRASPKELRKTTVECAPTTSNNIEKFAKPIEQASPKQAGPHKFETSRRAEIVAKESANLYDEYRKLMDNFKKATKESAALFERIEFISKKINEDDKRETNNGQMLNEEKSSAKAEKDFIPLRVDGSLPSAENCLAKKARIRTKLDLFYKKINKPVVSESSKSEQLDVNNVQSIQMNEKHEDSGSPSLNKIEKEETDITAISKRIHGHETSSSDSNTGSTKTCNAAHTDRKNDSSNFSPSKRKRAESLYYEQKSPLNNRTRRLSCSDITEPKAKIFDSGHITTNNVIPCDKATDLHSSKAVVNSEQLSKHNSMANSCSHKPATAVPIRGGITRMIEDAVETGNATDLSNTLCALSGSKKNPCSDYTASILPNSLETKTNKVINSPDIGREKSSECESPREMTPPYLLKPPHLNARLDLESGKKKTKRLRSDHTTSIPQNSLETKTSKVINSTNVGREKSSECDSSREMTPPYLVKPPHLNARLDLESGKKKTKMLLSDLKRTLAVVNRRYKSRLSPNSSGSKKKTIGDVVAAVKKYSNLLQREIQSELNTTKEIQQARARLRKLEQKEQEHRRRVKDYSVYLAHLKKNMPPKPALVTEIVSRSAARPAPACDQRFSHLYYSSPLNAIDSVCVDPYVELCSHFLTGICRDPECTYQHPKAGANESNSKEAKDLS